MDVNESRNAIIKHHNLKKVDDVYTFYYDETNNIRKLYLTEAGLNIEQADNFVLAGIVHKGLICNADYSTLFNKLGLQKTTKELKLKHVAKGNFLAMLGSKKLNLILKWLTENNFYIHYFNLNLMYWSLADRNGPPILDSLISASPG